MGEKAIIITVIGFILLTVSGIIALIDYVTYLLREGPFWGLLAITGLILGGILFIIGTTIIYGDN
ncbi:hypothetical protein KA005_67410 [bacterium]|nr:hypothetical protein [bacterium]